MILVLGTRGPGFELYKSRTTPAHYRIRTCEGKPNRFQVYRLNRVFIFCFVVVAMFLVTVCVDLADSEPAWLWIFVWSVIFVLPLTCRMKSELPKLSHRLEPLTVVTGPARAEEVVLFVALLTIVVVAGAKGSFEQAGSLFSDFFGSLLFAMAGEFVSLIWKYFFCSLCCRCCLPPGQSPGYPGEKGATIFV